MYQVNRKLWSENYAHHHIRKDFSNMERMTRQNILYLHCRWDPHTE